MKRWLRTMVAVSLVLPPVGVRLLAQTTQTLTLAWDANAETDVTGYEVSYGTRTRVYTTVVDVGKVTSRVFTLPLGTYFFVVKAYSGPPATRLYSPYSLEVSSLSTSPSSPTRLIIR